nr:hypothetical protein [Chlamydiota bacterium]
HGHGHENDLKKRVFSEVRRQAFALLSKLSRAGSPTFVSPVCSGAEGWENESKEKSPERVTLTAAYVTLSGL